MTFNFYLNTNLHYCSSVVAVTRWSKW